jgi:hypothetical protein
MFNVYLPKLLESAGPSDGDAPRPIAESLWDIVIFTLGGCPGALVCLVSHRVHHVPADLLPPGRCLAR